MASIETIGVNSYRISGTSGERHGEHRFRIVGNAIVSIYDGYCFGDFFEPASQILKKLIAERGKVVLFNDTTRLTGYEAAYREKWTQWFLKHRGDIDLLHILVKSGLVKMAMSLVSLAVSGLIKGYSDLGGFRAALGPLASVHQQLTESASPASANP
jgi:hypothetical protein